MGYHRAGFVVVGVDLRPQPRYPFEFVRADALEVLADRAFVAGFDAVHASPTCQHHANVTAWRGSRDDHPDNLTPTLALLAGCSVPYVVENVPEALPTWDLVLCGDAVGTRRPPAPRLPRAVVAVHAAAAVPAPSGPAAVHAQG
jgi:hypothetical protein